MMEHFKCLKPKYQMFRLIFMHKIVNKITIVNRNRCTQYYFNVAKGVEKPCHRPVMPVLSIEVNNP